jgi:hypothetical protein
VRASHACCAPRVGCAERAALHAVHLRRCAAPFARALGHCAASQSLHARCAIRFSADSHARCFRCRPQVEAFAQELAQVSLAHVRVLRDILADQAVACPAIDIGPAFAQAANQALNTQLQPPFDPYGALRAHICCAARALQLLRISALCSASHAAPVRIHL